MYVNIGWKPHARRARSSFSPSACLLPSVDMDYGMIELSSSLPKCLMPRLRGLCACVLANQVANLLPQLSNLRVILRCLARGCPGYVDSMSLRLGATEPCKKPRCWATHQGRTICTYCLAFLFNYYFK